MLQCFQCSVSSADYSVITLFPVITVSSDYTVSIVSVMPVFPANFQDLVIAVFLSFSDGSLRMISVLYNNNHSLSSDCIVSCNYVYRYLTHQWRVNNTLC